MLTGAPPPSVSNEVSPLLTSHAWLVYGLSAIAALFVGLSKAGFSGISLLAVFIFTDLFGAKASVGFALPLLVVADLTVYPAFRNHGSWQPVLRLLPTALLGMVLGWWCLSRISDATAKHIIGVSILLMVIVQFIRQRFPAQMNRLVDSEGFGLGAGVAGGMTTMMANAAGPVIQLYLLTRRIPKMEQLGVSARFFLVINLLKVPFTSQLGFFHRENLFWQLLLAPMVVGGVLLGKRLIQRVPQRAFEWMVMVFSIIAGLRLLLA
jgi:uncharacterized protein